MGVSSLVHWVVWDSGLSWLSWCNVRGGDIPIGMMWHLFLFPYIILVHCLPHVTNVVINLLFGVGSCKKIFSSWVLASVLPNTLWFDKEGGFFCGRLESQCYQRLLMGKKKGTSAVQAAGLPCCLPTTGKVRILPLVPFLTVQEETMPAAAGWLTQGCNHAVGVLRAASSSTGLLTTPTFFPHLETTILWLRLSPPLGCSHIPPDNYMLGSPNPIHGVWRLCAYVVISSQPLTEEKSTPPGFLAGCPRRTATSLILQRKIEHCWGQ